MPMASPVKAVNLRCNDRATCLICRPDTRANLTHHQPLLHSVTESRVFYARHRNKGKINGRKFPLKGQKCRSINQVSDKCGLYVRVMPEQLKNVRQHTMKLYRDKYSLQNYHTFKTSSTSNVRKKVSLLMTTFAHPRNL